ncbi:hypothetical protein [Novosphingobium sp. Chol11]|uniref:hypothetical protein n=1 Tax=Novosphingobium sp. Chol11 TaxID=1385763 RepID=UPI0025F075BF|nr:hypothetical protein [Novosphingobium sp. Chol11]
MNEQEQQPAKAVDSKGKDMKQAKKPLPANLANFLTSEYPAGPYVAALIDDNTRALDEDERTDGVKLVKARPELLPRVVELARASISRTVSNRVKLAISDLSSNVIRSQDQDLENWSRLAGSTGEAELGKLAQRLRKAREAGNKDLLQQAEHLLQLGLAVVIGRADFSLIGSLTAIYSNLVTSRGIGKSLNAGDLAKRALNRASIKNLEAYSAINAIASETLSVVQRQFATANEQLITLQDRVRDQRDQLERQSRAIEVLKAEQDTLADSLTEARAQISGVAGGRDADLNALRARYRKLLSGNLSEFVTQAHEALTSGQPAPEIAEVLLDDAKKAISKELEWLRQFLV